MAKVTKKKKVTKKVDTTRYIILDVDNAFNPIHVWGKDSLVKELHQLWKDEFDSKGDTPEDFEACVQVLEVKDKQIGIKCYNEFKIEAT